MRASGLNQVFTITDTNGNQYRKASQFNVTLDGVSLAIFYSENIRGGPNTVSVSDTISGTLRFTIQYAGVATSNSLDVTASREGTGTTPSTGAVSTTADGSLLVGALMTANAAAVTAGDGYTVRSRVPAGNNSKLVVEDRVQPVAGTASGTATLTSANVWGFVFAAFRPGGGSVPAPPGLATSPSPASGASNVPTNPSLTWTATGAASYDIRFGTSSTPPLVASNLTTPAYAPATLANNTTYNWQIVARNSAGTTAGPTWSFTTAQSEPPPPPPPPPAGVSLAQQAGKDAGTTTTTTLAFPSANTTSNFIAVAVRASGLNQVLTVSDTNGNQYRRAAQFNVTLDGVSLALFYAETVKSGTNTVTVASTQAGTLRISILEYSGVASSNALDVISFAQGSKKCVAQ